MRVTPLWSEHGTRVLKLAFGSVAALSQLALMSQSVEAAQIGAAASAIVDRTFACSVVASSRTYPDPDPRSRRIAIGIHRDVDPTRKSAAAVGVSDKNADSLVSVPHGPGVGRPTGGIWVNRTRCTWMKDVRVPLSPRGLPGPPTRYSSGFECVVPRRVLVRVRAVLRRPANWIAAGGQFVVRGDVAETQLAIRTLPARKPLALGVVDADGDSALHISANCVKEH
jgi:hypothetical protein